MQTMPAFVFEIPEMASPVQISGHYSNSLDFDQYLLASSPPGFTYNVLSKPGVCDSTTHYGHRQSDSRFPTGSDWYSSSSQFHESSSIKGSKYEQQLRLLANAQPLAISSKADAKTLDANRISASDGNIAANNPTGRSRCRRVKKVSFADDFGLRLTEVKLFSETPDMPSIIKMLNGPITFSTTPNCMPSLSTVPSINPLLVPDFPMPISNSAALNAKVERDFICLESLYVATNWTLLGTIKVKNLAFTKKVFVRCSFDAWQSSVDIPCNYRPKSYLEGMEHSFDWFTFTIGIPVDFKAGGSAAFAICFQCNSNEYWDNNSGANYRLTTPDWLKKDTEELNRNAARSVALKWAAYVDWKDRSMSWPYW